MKKSARTFASVASCLLLTIPAMARDSRLGANAFVDQGSKLQQIYQEWEREHVIQGGDREIRLGLGYIEGLSSAPTEAEGWMTFDLVDDTVSVTVRGLGKYDAEVYLVDNQGRGSIAPEPGDATIGLGPLQLEGTAKVLRQQLDSSFFRNFEVDWVVVVEAGKSPFNGSLLFGTPSLFQRLYMSSRHRSPVPRGRFASGSTVAYFDRLVERGAELFFTETFAGNSRTCSTCHPAGNNFTIDPEFIATLPADDPLFVAELDPRLADLEKSELLRRFSLVLGNVDGFDRPEEKFALRGVPHLQALNTSLSHTLDESGRPAQRLGWSGDGAPGGGSLREFTLGAIFQHFPKSLERRVGKDLRFPTEEELDALEAFQLTLGRDKDPDLTRLALKDPVAEQGRGLFLTTDTHGGTRSAGKCNVCHHQGGAIHSENAGNANLDTGIERLGHVARAVAPYPIDGGFGHSRGDSGQDRQADLALGDGTFNVAGLVEAADTAPYFHNGTIATLEEAVRHYSSDTFRDSPQGRELAGRDSNGVAMLLSEEDTQAIAAFLRVLNTAENIRSASEYLRTAGRTSPTASRELVELALADTKDAIEVLQQRALHPSAQAFLKSAREAGKAGLAAASLSDRRSHVGDALRFLSQARDDLGTGFD